MIKVVAVAGEDTYSEEEAARRSDAALWRLLATPPDHKRGPQAKAHPKKRGRPAGKNRNGSSTPTSDAGGHEPNRT